MKPRRANWARPSGLPFDLTEDARLADMVGCGLAVEFYKDNMPGRTLGEILARRLELLKAGQIQRAPTI